MLILLEGLMLGKTFVSNKKQFLAYNNFRKNIFIELAPKEGKTILTMLPWMLSVNDPAVPGFVPEMESPPVVFGIMADKSILKEEPAFKKIFDVRKSGPLLQPASGRSLIQGLYTIGSAGTISQTEASDCDIWVCINKDDFDETSREQLLQKINLIKDWLDSYLRLPVYFFICDVEDIKNANFGILGDESSGSAQRNVLKEEFYRTSILVCGKIPLWWVCFDPGSPVDYQEFAVQYLAFADYDFIDLGPMETIDREEYFGAALWQFNKALSHPLKSLIKMLHLEMLLGSRSEELLSHRFRNTILDQKAGEAVFHDPSIFTLEAILTYYQDVLPERFEFIKQCCYLRYGVKFYSKRVTLKEKLAREIFQRYSSPRDVIHRLNDFNNLPLLEQLEFGEKIFLVLLDIYKRIMSYQEDVTSVITRRDMTIMGRKLSAYLEGKPGKIPLIHKPLYNANLTNLTFLYDKGAWHVLTGPEPARSVVSGDIVYCIIYLLWNGLYQPAHVRMMPNPTPITLQEIHNLAKRIKEIFGEFDITAIEFDKFLEAERMTRMLVIVSSENPGTAMAMKNLGVVTVNNWGELFYRRLDSPYKFKEFVDKGGAAFAQTEKHYYIQRNSLYYEKLIDRVKELVNLVFSNVTSADS